MAALVVAPHSKNYWMQPRHELSPTNVSFTPSLTPQPQVLMTDLLALIMEFKNLSKNLGDSPRFFYFPSNFRRENFRQRG
jgi:hypothetical protein